MMSLRRNPKTTSLLVRSSGGNKKRTIAEKVSSSTVSTRRSQRTPKKNSLVDTKDNEHQQMITNRNNCYRRNLRVLEDRMLDRGVESYGRDFAYILSKMFPVHHSGSSSGNSSTSRRHSCNKTLDQIRQRYETLLSHREEEKNNNESSDQNAIHNDGFYNDKSITVVRNWKAQEAKNSGHDDIGNRATAAAATTTNNNNNT